jgi:hypothetical protein
VIGGDRVSKVEQTVGTLNVSDWFCVCPHFLEERRVVNVSGLLVPSVELSFRRLQVLPHLRTLQDAAVVLLEHLGVDALRSKSLDF